MSDHSVYLYAIGDAAIAGSEVLMETGGVGAAPVRTLVEGSLAAVVASVDRDRFSEESIRARLEDLEWLEKIARTHHEVVDRIARVHPIAPVRMATIYLDDANVRRLLRERAAELAATLDRIRGRSEWGVKGYAAPTKASAAEPAASASDAPGTSYLMRRRTERDRVAHRRERLGQAAEKLHQELVQLAADSRVHPPQDPRLTGRREEMILNAAYLVDEAGAALLAQRVNTGTDKELRLELTGPWAPYSFTSLGES
jgi:hypothetical protein